MILLVPTLPLLSLIWNKYIPLLKPEKPGLDTGH